MRDTGIAAQFTLTNARADRIERLWNARATSSFPVPVSPLMSTVASVGATRETFESSVRSAGDVPTISSNVEALSPSPRSATCSCCTRSFRAWISAKACSSEIQALKERVQQENVALREEVDKASMFEEIVGTSVDLGGRRII